MQVSSPRKTKKSEVIPPQNSAVDDFMSIRPYPADVRDRALLLLYYDYSTLY